MDRLILSKFSPPGVVIDEDLNVLQFRGRVGQFLEHQPGGASLNLRKLLAPNLLVALMAVVRQAKEGDAPVRRGKLRIRREDGFSQFDVEVLPIRTPEQDGRRFLIFFEETKPAVPPPNASEEKRGSHAKTEAVDSVAKLREELTSTREYLQSAVTERETAIGELQSLNEEILSFNEELQSTNEELQTTNEELETAKEELQSTNEETRTINDELRSRNAELGLLNDDLANVLLGVQVPILLLGADLRVRRFTPPLGDVFEVDGHTVGRPIEEVRTRLQCPDLTRKVAEVLKVGLAKVEEVHDSEHHWYEMHIRPYLTSQKEVAGVLLVFFDISDRHWADQALQEARTSAEAASALKDRFLAALSHELRTPITPVLMAVTMLEERPDLPPDLKEDLRVIRRGIDLEARLADDLLDLNRISKGKVVVLREPVEIHSLLEQVLRLYCMSEVKEKGISVEVRAEAKEHRLLGDADRLQQVFWNLLKNAIKFTPEGGLIEVRTGNHEPGKITVAVTDSGIGMEPEVVEKIFQPFEQGGGEVTKRYGGLGMGLAIAKSIVEQHDGKISARSPGKGLGSSFVVELPTTEIEKLEDEVVDRDEEDGLQEPLRSLKVLLVEDDQDTRKIFTRFLLRKGHQVDVASSISSAKALAAARLFDLVISDLGLPDGNGLDLMRFLRARYSLQGIALSGYGMEDDVRKSREAGFVEHLTKPVSFRDLSSAISRSSAADRT